MEVYVRNLPDAMTERQVQTFFKPHLAELKIYTFRVQKHVNKRFALLTFIDVSAGNRFLQKHGQTQPGKPGFEKVKIKLFHMRRPINCMQSDSMPDRFVISSLQEQEIRRLAKVEQQKFQGATTYQHHEKRRVYPISATLCGQWDYQGSRCVFKCYYQESRGGRVLFGRREVVLQLEASADQASSQQVVMPYSSIESFIIDPDGKNPSLTFSLSQAPKLYEMVPLEVETQLAGAMQALGMHFPPLRRPYNPIKRKRLSYLSKAHEAAAASCLCYRLLLADHRDLRALRALGSVQEIPRSVSYSTPVEFSTTFQAQLTQLNNALAGRASMQISFGVKFQLLRLAQNGYLPPIKVVNFINSVLEHSASVSWEVITRAIQRLADQIPYAGPGTDSFDLSLQALSRKLGDNVESIVKEDSYTQHSEQPGHIAQVLKAVVTPTGIHLYGPEPEIKNRVLRIYSSHLDYFLQVSFLDEDLERIWYDRVSSNDHVYHGKFKKILQSTINIAGRGYEFLGFSHSSLRTQTCWFMAPFTVENQLLYARGLIARLGEFGDFQSPARCAARIGQAFSQTFSSVKLPKEAIKVMPDIKRGRRIFSDGVGTCSASVLRIIHDGYAQSKVLKPTLLQIRFQGAKGMISLDNRIEDHAIYLRPSMIKFEGSPAQDIEICGAAFKPLAMYLNRQMIKILEDLAVPAEAFLSLQDQAVERLRTITQSPINASSFLRRISVGKSARLPYLVEKLERIGISYTNDQFLKQVLEVCILVELRELKHRSRIPVEQGMTVYGIMDETGVLREGEIYCSVHKAEQDPLILTGSVVITRCPALHPGDVQCVEAVDVPATSPLRALQNCVVFSQHGERDLPSQLSGGDLDGDLYNIIYDDSLYPGRTSPPADYDIVPPLDIGRPVTSRDMSDFFIQFMENDALGRISTLHQTLADMHSEGVFHSECIDLARLASTAVDFSKTGIAVDQSQIPRAPKVKPDFQAPGPRVLLENTIRLEDIDEFEDREEIEELEAYAPPTTRYYPSEKVLGILYRAIDEHELFQEIQQMRPSNYLSSPDQNQLDAVWNYEANLIDTMYTYASQPHQFISEVEVFSGSIIGKHGAQTKRQREFSTTMKERQERDVDYIVKCILQGEDGSGTSEALERSMACLWVGHQEISRNKKVGRLVSFAWIAAAVCLREVEKLLDNPRVTDGSAIL